MNRKQIYRLRKEVMLDAESGQLDVRFEYRPFLADFVKGLHNAQWQAERKRWLVPPTKPNIKELRDWGFIFRDEALKFLPSPTVEKARERYPLKQVLLPDDLGLGAELLPFQRHGVKLIEQRGGRVLLADEMGLGKTVQAIAWKQLHPEIEMAVVVCPSSLTLNWKKEFRWWAGEDAEVLSGLTPRELTVRKTYIVSYDALGAWIDVLLRLKPQLVVADECHYAKNLSTLRTKALKALCRQVPHLLMLSGTPVLNRPLELHAVLQMLDPVLFRSRWDFKLRYCDAKHSGFGYNFDGAANTLELNELLTASVMVRRLKCDILTELPAKNRSVIPLEMESVREYREARKELVDWLNDTPDEGLTDVAVKTHIEDLKQAAVRGKFMNMVDWIRNYLDTTGRKLVIFAFHKSVIEQLRLELAGDYGAMKMDGSTPMIERQRRVELFQSDPKHRVLVGQIDVLGVGWTLTAAEDTCHVELAWKPGQHDQAEDRCYGRMNDPHGSTAYYLIAGDSIEEEIATEYLDKKRVVLREILDGKPRKDISEKELLGKLIKKLRAKRPHTKKI